MSTFPSYTIAPAPAASQADLGQDVFGVIPGVAPKVMNNNHKNQIVHTQYEPFMKGNEWAMTVRSAA